MDETALVLHVTGLRGTVVKVSAPKQAAIERASLADRRSYISYLACITHDAAVQALLPQVLLGNEHQFTLALLRSVSSQLGPNIQLWRQKSAWNSHQTMRRWLTTLKKALGSLVESGTVVVLVDVHPSHMHNTIFQHARRCGVRLVYIPAKLTAFLQPCDTHLFAMFKKTFWNGWRKRKSEAIDGSVSTAEWLQIIADTIAKVLPRTTWIKAFRAVGILDQQRVLSLKLAEKLGFDGALDLPSMLPSVEDAQCIFPSNMKLDVLSYLTWQPKAWRIKGSLPKPASSEPALPQPGPRLRRTLPASFHSAGRKIRTLD